MNSSEAASRIDGDAAFEIHPLAGSLGAEIRGLDVRRLDDHAFGQLQRAFLDYQAIILRDQDLSPDEYRAFALRWGKPAIYPYVKGLETHPDILELLRTEKDGYAFGNVWHTDGSNYAIPPQATMLYSLELPPAGGDTQFANMYAAYETLSDGMKEMLCQLRALNAGERKLAFSDQVSSMVQKDPGEFQVNALHPIVRTHPQTGRKALFVGHRIERFEGMTPEETAPLVAYLRQHATRPEFTCRFRWEVGSLGIWDNRCTQHYAVDDYAGHRRRMHRITIEGDEVPF